MQDSFRHPQGQGLHHLPTGTQGGAVAPIVQALPALALLHMYEADEGAGVV